MSNRLFQLYFRLVYVLVASTGVFLALEVGSSTIFNQTFFVYYTNLSNLIGLIFGFFLLKETWHYIQNKELKGFSNIHPKWHFIIAILLLVTLLIYNTLLGNMFSTSYWRLRNVIMHLVAPSMMVLDYILFSVKGKMKYKDVFYSLIMPYIYVIYALIRGLFVRDYPYFFLDLETLGFLGVLRWVFILTFIFIGLSLGFVYINRNMDQKTKTS